MYEAWAFVQVNVLKRSTEWGAGAGTNNKNQTIDFDLEELIGALITYYLITTPTTVEHLVIRLPVFALPICDAIHKVYPTGKFILMAGKPKARDFRALYTPKKCTFSGYY